MEADRLIDSDSGEDEVRSEWSMENVGAGGTQHRKKAARVGVIGRNRRTSAENGAKAEV